MCWLATQAGKMKWTYVLIGYPSKQDEVNLCADWLPKQARWSEPMCWLATQAGKMSTPLTTWSGLHRFDPAPEGSLKICVEPTYKLSNFWTISLIEMQKAAEDSQNKDLCDLSQFKLS